MCMFKIWSYYVGVYINYLYYISTMHESGSKLSLHLLKITPIQSSLFNIFGIEAI